MQKLLKIFLIILAILFVLAFVAWIFVGIAWNGGFNFLFPEEIATYESPDGKYTLVFEQMGSPAWPFGPADVRLTLKNSSGKKIDRIYAEVYNDGGSAHSKNIKDIQWGQTQVTVTLDSVESEDQILVLSIS